jgi:hypothetical protein
MEFLTGEFAVGGMALQYWMPIVLLIFFFWIALIMAIKN